MAEHPLNYGPVCEKHAPRPDPQYFDKPIEWFINRTVNLGFPVGPNEQLEHMFVQVMSKAPEESEHELAGILANDSIFSDELQCGAAIAFNRNEVEAVWQRS